MKKKNKLCICLPHTFSQFDKEFVESLLNMTLYFNEWCKQARKDYSISYLIQDGFQLDTIRNDLVISALKHDHDYLLFLDTDMVFPQQTIKWMIEDFEDNQDLEVDAITGLSVLKEPPHLPVIFPRFNQETLKYEMAGTFPTKELFQVEGTGMACTMIRRQVFDKATYPYFKFIYKGESADYPYGIGEDLYFCHQNRPFLLCDPRIKTGHIQKKAYTIDDYVNYNGLTQKEDGIEATDKQLKEILDRDQDK